MPEVSDETQGHMLSREDSPLEFRVTDVFLPYLTQCQCRREREPVSSKTFTERIDRGVRGRTRQRYIP